ncbi:LysR family transcriptional regulator [Mesosutterella sp. AGMB02718]|uniref:LysR family transcriptional regulator n=1 Tax=Mesosutterella faecium TaxID=2925194 RepID=A0ABT7IQW7_9BURK|nr:LysR family transcriptional regulator [Mesosutterella sp. AGMB02718]MDL2059706.1 LysR family transcriptional regulator [Mesosutterella sp. AGMB02718]
MIVKRFDYRLIRQLLLFAVVVEEKSIRRAAKRLAMSQPPLSAQLDELEARLGMKLLQRNARGVTPTQAGEAMMPDVLRLIGEAEKLDYSVRQIREGQCGVLNAGAVLEAMLGWVPQFRYRLKKAMPGLALYTKEIDSGDAESELLSGRIAFASGYFGRPRSPFIQRALLFREKPVALLPLDHRLAGRGRIRLADLSGEEFVLPARSISPFFVDSLIGACRTAGFDPRIRHEVSTTMREMAYVGCGQGIGLVPAFFTRMVPPSVKAVHLSDVGPVIELSAAWCEDRQTPLSRRALALIQAAPERP